MLNIMRRDDIPEDAELAQVIALTALRFEAAKAAAPYCHAKLSAVDLSGQGPNGEHVVNINVGFD
jgi:hypothetical protein